MCVDSPGSTDSNSRRLGTSARTLARPSSISAVPDANSTSPETTHSVKPWLQASGLPWETLEARATARGISLEMQIKGMLQYCLDNGVNGD